MTRAGGSIRSGPPRAPRAPRGRGSNGDPYGIAPIADWVAPILAVVGLLIVGSLTWALVTGSLPLPGTSRPGGGPNPGGGVRTPAPSGVVVVPVDPRADVPGSIVYVKGGNIWVQSGTAVRQVTRSGAASQPAWSADGEWIYFIETREEIGRFPAQGTPRRYVMPVPTLMRVRPDEASEPERIATGKITPGSWTWFHWLRQPAPHPDGVTVAVISDGPDPTERNMIVQLLNMETGKYSVPEIPETAPFGHQDPAWRPDGALLLAVRNGRDGSRGAPTIVRWNAQTGRVSNLTGPGYLSPAWSRDLRWVAATKTTNTGTDIVILDGRTGAEVFRATDDGTSWSPTWSPLGDAVAFLHEANGIVDLRMVKLGGSAPSWQVTDTINLTEVSGLEATSRPGWFIPPSELPPLPTPVPSADGSGAPPGSAAPASAAP